MVRTDAARAAAPAPASVCCEVGEFLDDTGDFKSAPMPFLVLSILGFSWSDTDEMLVVAVDLEEPLHGCVGWVLPGEATSKVLPS